MCKIWINHSANSFERGHLHPQRGYSPIACNRRCSYFRHGLHPKGTDKADNVITEKLANPRITESHVSTLFSWQEGHLNSLLVVCTLSVMRMMFTST